MDVDGASKPAGKLSSVRRGIVKRKAKRSAIVFPKYGDKKIQKKRK